VAIGGIDSYDFHALETIQCMAERRRGGETGVVAMHALRGDAVWRARDGGSWSAVGWDPQLFEACLSRSHTLAQPESFSHRYPTADQIRQWVKEPIAYRFEYADGLKATMLLMNGLVDDFTFAARLKGESAPLATLFHLPPTPNVVYSTALMSKAEDMSLGGRAAYPVERTLLTSGLNSLARFWDSSPTRQRGSTWRNHKKSGPVPRWRVGLLSLRTPRITQSHLVAAGVRSLASGQKRIETPHLAVRYQAPRESQFWRS